MPSVMGSCPPRLRRPGGQRIRWRGLRTALSPARPCRSARSLPPRQWPGSLMPGLCASPFPAPVRRTALSRSCRVTDQIANVACHERMSKPRMPFFNWFSSPGCRWVPRCTWRRAWTRPGRRRCCWSRSGSSRRPRGRPRGSMWSRWIAGSGSARSSRDRCAAKMTGRSDGPGAGVTCVTRWGRFSVPGRSGSSSGCWRRPGGGTCTPGSTRPGYRCGIRPGGRDGHTHWREMDARHRAIADLAWLTPEWADGSPGMS